jgi:hypothetical protein
MAVIGTDPFTRGDAANLGADWTEIAGLTEPGIFSNQVDTANPPFSDWACRTLESYPADQYSQAVLVALASAEWFVLVRGRTTVQTDLYAGGYSSTQAGDTNLRIFKMVNNVFTSLANFGSQFLAATDVVRLEVKADDLELFVDGISKLTAANDPSLTSGPPGIGVSHSAGNVALLDDWEGGDFAAPPGTRFVLSRF